MKNNRFILFQIMALALALVFRFLSSQNLIYAVLAPLNLLANYLREMSLSGPLGNLIAWIIYLTVSFMPCFIFVIMFKKRLLTRIDYGLLVISLVLLGGLYHLINPDDIPLVSQLAISSLFEALVIGYIIIRIVTIAANAHVNRISGYLKIAFSIISFVFSFIFYFESMPLFGTSPFEGMAFLTFVINLLDLSLFLLIAYIMERIAKVFQIYQIDPYNHEIPVLLKKIDHLSVRALIYIVSVQIFIQLLYLVFGTLVNDADLALNLPLIPLIMILIGLFLAKIFEENFHLKEDNDLLI